MITARDLEYHAPPDADHRWAETYFLPIPVPDEHLLVVVYVVVRPTVGVMVNDVVAYGALVDNRAELLYADVQQHLPAPERFSDIDSPSGLRVEAVDPPRGYRIDYVGYDETEIHVDWTGIMDPFDIHDPDHSPKAAATVEEKHAGSGLGKAWSGHFDMTGRVTGTVTVRGEEFQVDAIERMDHSWGPRDEIDIPAMDSISAHFGEELAMHVISHLDLDAPIGSDQTLAHGYVIEDGEVYGVVELEMRTSRAGIIIASMDMKVTDVRGKVFDFHAVADVGGPWIAYTSHLTWNSMMRWALGDRVGHGVVNENIPLAAATKRRGRRWTDHPAALK